jgi:alpha-methylacyl-CoA racemase
MGPLAGITAIEMKGIGPGPYAGMLLADMGADVIVVERANHADGIGLPAAHDIHCRGKRSIILDIKQAAGLKALLKLIDKADMLIDPYRPGVAERAGFGPEVCLQSNPALVFGRVTGWGQDGPLAHTAGHDLNYIALSGALAAIGSKEKPAIPLNLIGDYAGGSLFLLIGMLAALTAARQTGKGQVVDAAISDGTASLMSLFHSLAGIGAWQARRHSNFLDGGAPYYNVYETSDQQFLSVAALEPQFLRELLLATGLDEDWMQRRENPAHWPALHKELAAVFRSRSQQEWCDTFAGSDACVTPVLDYTTAPLHPHNKARHTYIEVNGLTQPAPAPRFSSSPAPLPGAPHAEGSDTAEVLQGAGYTAADIAALRDAGVLG